MEASVSAEHAAPRVWSADEIVASIKAWDADFGRPPTSTDWNPRSAPGHPALADRLARLDGRDVPSVASVRARFGSWGAAVSAAGFVPARSASPRNSGQAVALRDFAREVRALLAGPVMRGERLDAAAAEAAWRRAVAVLADE